MGVQRALYRTLKELKERAKELWENKEVISHILEAAVQFLVERVDAG